MAKQRHDIGWKKRRARELPPAGPKSIDTAALARLLVERGLSTKQILELNHK